jgi:hypothetical protein
MLLDREGAFRYVIGPAAARWFKPDRMLWA